MELICRADYVALERGLARLEARQLRHEVGELPVRASEGFAEHGLSPDEGEVVRGACCDLGQVGF